MGTLMATTKPQKPRFNLLGYGAIALYVSLLAMVGAGLYGFSLSSLWAAMHKAELTRAQLRTGRMVMSTTEDRMQCRSVKFNNETAELGEETVADCEVFGQQRSSGSSFNIFRNGFVNR